MRRHVPNFTYAAQEKWDATARVPPFGFGRQLIPVVSRVDRWKSGASAERILDVTVLGFGGAGTAG